MFGLVRSVAVVVDPMSSSAGTYILATHVRTIEEQQIALKEHPLYHNRWVRTPLLKIDGYTRKGEPNA
jgi:hypothetical protein